MAMNARDTRRILEAIKLLEALSDERNAACSLPPEVKRAARPYLQSWVLPLLEMVRDNEPKRHYE